MLLDAFPETIIMKNQKNINTVMKPQRAAAGFVIRGYNTIAWLSTLDFRNGYLAGTDYGNYTFDSWGRGRGQR